MIRTVLLTVLAFAVVVASGLCHGLWTDRWQRSAALEEAIAQLGRVPREVGDWKGEDVEMNARDMERTGAAAWLARRYVNQATGASVSIFLVCGHSGPVSVHTPDVCYGGSGYETVGRPVEQDVQLGADGTPSRFWTALFRKENSATDEHLRIFWSWSPTGSEWSAPTNPRLAFVRSPALFKLYAIHALANPDDKAETDPALDLLRRLLPELDAPPPSETPQ